MSEVKQIGGLKAEGKLPAVKNRKEPLIAGKAFESQLKETVEKLKGLDKEVDAMLESTQPRNLKTPVSLVGKPRTQEVIAENISAAAQASPKSAKYVAAQYEQLQSKK